MKACPGYGTLNEDENNFCISCREKIEGSILFCRHCGYKVVSSSKFCKSCGNEVVKEASVSQHNDILEKFQQPPENENFLFCLHCGKGLSGNSRFCKYCGSEVKEPLSSIATASSNTKIVHPAEIFVEKTISEKTLAIAKPGKSRKKLVITLSVVLPIVFLLAIFITLVAVFGKGIPDGLSIEQKKLVSSFGNPGEYAIIFDRESSKRVDMWIYPELERYFIFENGKYSGGKEVINPDLKKDEIKVVPEDFTKGMKMDDVIDAVGVQPQKNTDSKSGVTALSFYNGLLTVAFNEKEEIVNVTRTKEIN